MEKWWAKRTMDDNDKAIVALGLEDEVAALDEVGLAIVPRSKLGLDDDFFAMLKGRLVEVAESRIGVSFGGGEPSVPLTGQPGEIGQVTLTHLLYEDPIFRRVLTHPVKKALMRHLLGDLHRASVSNGWVKWQTPQTHQGPITTQFHADQDNVTSPWDWRHPHVSNMNWLLTDYTHADGAFAYVPGSHQLGRSPKSQEEALDSAVALEAPAGSLVMFSGCLWHGAFRKQTPGLRLSMHGLHCAHYYLPQQDFKGRIPEVYYESSDDPDYLRMLMREDEPWLEAEVDGAVKVPRPLTSASEDWHF